MKGKFSLHLIPLSMSCILISAAAVLAQPQLAFHESPGLLTIRVTLKTPAHLQFAGATAFYAKWTYSPSDALTFQSAVPGSMPITVSPGSVIVNSLLNPSCTSGLQADLVFKINRNAAINFSAPIGYALSKDCQVWPLPPGSAKQYTTIMGMGTHRRALDISVNAARIMNDVQFGRETAVTHGNEAGVAASLVVDHKAIDAFDRGIPRQWVDVVKSQRMAVSFIGASHARQIHYGLLLLKAKNPLYNADVAYSPGLYTNENALRDLTGWFDAQYNKWQDLGGATEYWLNDSAKQILRNTIGQARLGLGYQVTASLYGWSYHMCNPAYSTNEIGHPFSDSDLSLYLTAISGFNSDAAVNATKFIYITSVSDCNATYGANMNRWNDMIRAEAQTRGGVLFDQADIENWNNTNTTRYIESGIYLRSPDYNDGVGPDSYTGDHANDALEIRKAKAIWWMMVRLAGWDGISDTTTTTTTSSTTTRGTSSTTTSTTLFISTTTSSTSATTSTSTTLAPEYSLYFPLVVNSSQLTGIAVANPGPSATTLTFAAYNNSGSLISSSASGKESIRNPSVRVLEPGHQIAEVGFQIFGNSLNTEGAWCKVSSTRPGIAGFYLTFDGALSVMDGTEVSDRLMSECILAEVENAEISMVNPSNRQAQAVVSLVNSQGQAVSMSQPIQIPANGRYSNPVAGMFSPSQVEQSAYLMVAGSPALVAAEVFGVANCYIDALNAVDLNGGSKRLYSPQYVFIEGAWKTLLKIINLENAPTNIALELFDDTGTQRGYAATINLPAKGSAVLANPSLFGVRAPVEGYVRVTSSSTRVTGYARFGDPNDAQYQTALPFVSQGLNETFFSQVAQNQEYFTGVAVLNSNPETANITVRVFSTEGVQVGAGSVVIPPNGRVSRLLSQIIPGLPPMAKGYFRLSSDKPVLSFGVFGTTALSVLSAILGQPLVVFNSPGLL